MEGWSPESYGRDTYLTLRREANKDGKEGSLGSLIRYSIVSYSYCMLYQPQLVPTAPLARESDSSTLFQLTAYVIFDLAKPLTPVRSTECETDMSRAPVSSLDLSFSFPLIL